MYLKADMSGGSLLSLHLQSETEMPKIGWMVHDLSRFHPVTVSFCDL